MAAELNPLDGQINGGGGGSSGSGEGGGRRVETTVKKRQRRPSVRLSGIGGDPPLLPAYEHLQHHRRSSSKQLLQLQKGIRLKNNETLMDKFDNSDDGMEGFVNEGEENGGDLDLDRVAIGNWKNISKSKRGRGGSIRKRVRSNWVSSKIDENDKLLTSGDGEEEDREDGFHLENDEDMERDFARENLEEDMDDDEEGNERNESPIRSFNNDEDVDGNGGVGFLRSRGTRVDKEMDGPSDSTERNGVKVWLNQLGLGRYAPVFEVHEVDDEVLPMLTLEDLKDMGISAVGTRRKMYCSIQKLNKGFS